MEQKIMVLCDTNVIIEILKASKATINDINSIGLDSISISSITEMELYFGAFDKKELLKTKKGIKSYRGYSC